LIGYIIIYDIITKLFIMDYHPSQNRKWNSGANVLKLFGPDGFFQFFNKLERFVAAKYF
jgi:hypothetical protein